jgi:transcription termination factor Rho
MTLPKLKEVASQLGIEGAAKLKKDDLVTAIADLQAANREAAKAEREARREARNAKKNNRDNKNSDNSSDEGDDEDDSSDNSPSNNDRGNDRDDRGGRNRRDRNRGRDRNRDRGNREEREPVIGEDDVLVPVGGLVDIMDNYSFIRTGGYLPGPNDVYVSQGQVRKYGLRKGDVVTGQVRQAREGETRQKYNPLITLETINGMPFEERAVVWNSESLFRFIRKSVFALKPNQIFLQLALSI